MAITSPLLEVDITGGDGRAVNVTGPRTSAARAERGRTRDCRGRGPEAEITSARRRRDAAGRVRITVIGTGFNGARQSRGRCRSTSGHASQSRSGRRHPAEPSLDQLTEANLPTFCVDVPLPVKALDDSNT